ncbi:MAG: YtxH domain-containing protein [Cyanobacteriota bacterium]|nr:YtxH domain-containing protein [Cyanobacteriota bacterium]
MADNRTGAFIGGLLLGTAIGTAVGLLLAPRSGRETRRFLRKSAEALPEVAEDVTSNLQIQTEKLLDSAQKSLDETLVRLQEAIATGKEAMLQKRRELDQQSLRATLRDTAEPLAEDEAGDSKLSPMNSLQEATPYRPAFSSSHEEN